MFFLLLGIYLAFLLIMWGFFGVAWIHAYKFKNFSGQIVFVSRVLLFFLLVLSCIGFFIIYILSTSQMNFSLGSSTTPTLIENQNYY